ncbi:MAG: hypothetical protein A2469_03845 [Candidatus Magasanikbacteria bacterium RIFOXYC2_FULL_40_16]|uniref:Uncharacterized protein n=3 Tax=Candidatus Magasanikiibacteriota TaxID=1752731 RepID=A0A1F6NEP6_9BACT|nr:MAG: hypothetical protein A2224_03145 [Candidatus Magasanikbacteria bacterium RIFOXYA2_FULL_40_20]OGH82392.1 MAG: hypothetical protein A2373_03110 [Candidatus Magasanikbacteria bacterium RIFOXYB1_FULL_40_15]OGH85127.1 MAG: hypothetical protein A2301_01830 [Candidatus Magasanikbacteria bacterium RIFOXYB2_FULL_40_13]OGH87872.1 MAG: hypothetical protein A2206_00160 [Candidatus Magasanikbacteria bacterium RIFOXYA1_FULL_40_8]OGH89372.1 MAG: hypothetical protein A2469_03845 [Candidatus Magasanikba
MKSPEQPGPQELPAEEAVKTEERKITTPEQWAEITQQQRMALGLKEVYNLSPEQIEEIEKSIDKLLIKLYEYNFNNYPEVEEESIWIESEALSGNDRVVALRKLMEFLQYMEDEYGLSEEKK